jgi:hypothetical protein
MAPLLTPFSKNISTGWLFIDHQFFYDLFTVHLQIDKIHPRNFARHVEHHSFGG